MSDFIGDKALLMEVATRLGKSRSARKLGGAWPAFLASGEPLETISALLFMGVPFGEPIATKIRDHSMHLDCHVAWGQTARGREPQRNPAGYQGVR